MFIYLSNNLGEDDQGYPVVCVGGGTGLPVRSHHLRRRHLGPQVHQLSGACIETQKGETIFFVAMEKNHQSLSPISIFCCSVYFRA